MNLRPHTTILPQNNFMWIEPSVPPIIQDINPLRLELHNMYVLLFCKGQATGVNKLGIVAYRKFMIRGIKNKFVLELGT